MNWQEYHFKYFKNYYEPAGTVACPSVPQAVKGNQVVYLDAMGHVLK